MLLSRSKELLMRRKQGFTLVEIMIVVAIIGVLSALAIPSFRRARHTSLEKAFINDLRVATDAFQSYNFNNLGGYPSNVTAGIVPPEMVSYLTKFPWDRTTQVGGKWDWDYMTIPLTALGVKAAIGVSGATWTDAEMQEVDAAIDDGDLNSGSFRKINIKFLSIIE